MTLVETNLLIFLFLKHIIYKVTTNDRIQLLVFFSTFCKIPNKDPKVHFSWSDYFDFEKITLINSYPRITQLVFMDCNMFPQLTHLVLSDSIPSLDLYNLFSLITICSICLHNAVRVNEFCKSRERITYRIKVLFTRFLVSLYFFYVNVSMLFGFNCQPKRILKYIRPQFKSFFYFYIILLWEL